MAVGEEAEQGFRFAGLREGTTLQACLRDCFLPQTEDRTRSMPLLFCNNTGGRGILARPDECQLVVKTNYSSPIRVF